MLNISPEEAIDFLPALPPSGNTPARPYHMPLSALIAMDMVERGLMSPEEADMLKESLMGDDFSS